MNRPAWNMGMDIGMLWKQKFHFHSVARVGRFCCGNCTKSLQLLSLVHEFCSIFCTLYTDEFFLIGFLPFRLHRSYFQLSICMMRSEYIMQILLMMASGPCQWLTHSRIIIMKWMKISCERHIVISCCIDAKNDLIIIVVRIERVCAMCRIGRMQAYTSSQGYTFHYWRVFFPTVNFVEWVSSEAVGRRLYDSFHSMHFLSDPVTNSEWRTYNTYIELTKHIYLELKAMLNLVFRYSLSDLMLYVSRHQQNRRGMETKLTFTMRITTIQQNKHVKNEIIRNDFLCQSQIWCDKD